MTNTVAFWLALWMLMRRSFDSRRTNLDNEFLLLVLIRVFWLVPRKVTQNTNLDITSGYSGTWSSIVPYDGVIVILNSRNTFSCFLRIVNASVQSMDLLSVEGFRP